MKIKNSTILYIGLVFVILGIIVVSYDYMQSKKDKVFSEMNLKLYESETPKKIEENEEINPIVQNNTTNNVTNTTNTTKPNNNITYNFIGTLEIPKISLKRGFVDINSKYNNVDYNITIIKGSTMPDEEYSNLILAAHSGYCSICFFNQLYKVSVGDYAYVTYKGTKYSYKVVKIYDVEKNGTVTIYRNSDKKALTLITCTRNSDTKQTVYILEIVD